MRQKQDLMDEEFIIIAKNLTHTVQRDPFFQQNIAFIFSDKIQRINISINGPCTRAILSFIHLFVRSFIPDWLLMRWGAKTPLAGNVDFLLEPFSFENGSWQHKGRGQPRYPDLWLTHASPCGHA